MGRITTVVIGLLVLSAGCLGGSQFPAELGQPAVEEHESSLSATESYTVEITLQFSRGTAASGGAVVYRVDNRNGRFYTRQDIDVALSGVTNEKYTDSELTARRSDMSLSDGHAYQYGEPPYDDEGGGIRPVRTSSAEQGIVDGLGSATVQRNGTTEYRGETVGVYTGGTEFVKTVQNQTRESQEPGDRPDSSSILSRNRYSANLTSGNITVYLGPDGIIRYQRLQLVQQQRDDRMMTEITYKVYSVNNTTVERPTWIDEARESNSSSGFGGGLF